MRAYMSSELSRSRYGERQHRPYHAECALAEARAILAETEPGILAFVGSPYEQSTPLWVRTLKGDPDNAARHAIKVALRAFVED